VDIAWFRDLVIIIQGILAIGLLILLGFLAFALYRSVKGIGESAKKIMSSAQEVVDSAKATVDNFAAVSSFARSEMAMPLVRTAGIIQGVSKGLETIMGFFKRSKGGERCE